MTETLITLLVSVGLVGLAAFTGIRFRPDEWYQALEKPGWTPPNRLFPIAWSILYLLMAIAAWQVYLAPDSPERSGALTFYFLQLISNGAWSWFFFGKRSILLALIDIVLLLVLLTITIALFAQVSLLATTLMMPYWFWVAFATALTGAVWTRNR